MLKGVPSRELRFFIPWQKENHLQNYQPGVDMFVPSGRYPEAKPEDIKTSSDSSNVGLITTRFTRFVVKKNGAGLQK